MQQRKKPAKRAYVPGLGGVAHVDESVQPQQPPANVPLPPPAPLKMVKVPLDSVECKYHGLLFPCEVCEKQQSRAAQTLQIHALRRELQKAREEVWRDVVKSAGIDPKTKCVHGHYLYEFYCDVCRLAPVDLSYDPDVYRTEITKALGQTSKLLYGEEGRKDFQDLKCIVDIEIWKASKQYGDQMNAKLAYTVARNQVGKYLAERMEEPEFVSMDDKPLDDSGNEMPSAAEIAVESIPPQEAKVEFDPEVLQPLIAQWHGSKRKVAEAMLLPDFTVRGVPGVDKSTVFRLRKIILENFKSFLDNSMGGKNGPEDGQ